jgi:UDP-N-acetylglucosamine 2-epimerase
MDLLSIVGARPQFIKAAAVHRALERLGARHGLLHTGQHYDAAMSQVFLEELGMPRPLADLGIGSGLHGEQTARMIAGIEQALLGHQPRAVILYGDTNSTLAGALAAAKLRIPIAHVEAGLRSFNKAMPEELNRVLTDHCSTWLFCPTTAAISNLEREGFTQAPGPASPDRPQCLLVGDVMHDSALHYAALAGERSRLQGELGLRSEGYLLATVHRDFNTDAPARLAAIIAGLQECAAATGLPVVMPVHPRTKAALAATRLEPAAGVLMLIDPVGYLDMIALERGARLILTDSGGVQKEAHFFRKPCVVLRPETEWTELVEHGQAVLADADAARIGSAVERFLEQGLPECPALYGDGRAADRIAHTLA